MAEVYINFRRTVVCTMTYDQLLGNYQDEQVRASQILAEHGPLNYEELKNHLGLEDDGAMEEVMRGLQWNGLTEVYVTDRGGFEYGAPDDVDLDELMVKA